MSNFEDRLPDELRELASRLREERAEATGLDLDRIKTNAMAKATAPRRKGFVLRSRGMAALLTLALMAAGTGGVLAGGGNGHSNHSSASTQYKPGKGCGDKNHTHTGPPGNPSNTSCPHH